MAEALAHASRSRQLAAGLALLAVLLVALSLASLAVGARAIPISEVVHALFNPAADGTNATILRDLRIPRTLLALLVGAAIGLSGAIMQGVTRNPLADPGLLGINAGAALFVVLGISIFGLVTLTAYVWLGFAGAAVATALVYAVASLGREGATPIKLALAGAAITAAFGSITTGVLMTDATTLDAFRFWQVGSLAGRGNDILLGVAPFLVVGIALALITGRLLDAMALGDDIARGLGQRVLLSRIIAALTWIVLAGGATAAAGPIAFVGLTVPHAARAITGPSYRWILPYSAVMAPILLLAADILGRVLAPPGELQVGIVTAALGRTAVHPARPPPEARRAMNALPKPNEFIDIGADVAGIREALARRRMLVIGGLALLVVAGFVTAMLLGDFPVTPEQIVGSLLSPFTGATQKGIDFIVLGVRLPRALVALLAGAAFGVSGALFQGVLRNPLASPDIIGITMGASTTAVAAMLLHWGGGWLAGAALFGGLATAALIYLIAWQHGVSPYRVVLVGIGVGAVMTAIMSYLFTRARLVEVQQAVTWLTGSLNGVQMKDAGLLAAEVAVLAVLLLPLSRAAGALELGDDTARALGSRVERSRVLLLGVGVALCALATAVTGPIAFVSLMAAPIARLLLGPAGGTIVPAALTGAAVTLGADIVAQHFLLGVQLPVGVVTGGVGALFLIAMLITANKTGRTS